MNTAETIATAILGCGTNDLDYLFGDFIESGIFYRVVKDASSFDAGDLWRECVFLAVEDAFDAIYPYTAEFDYIAPRVYMDSDDVSDIDSFDEKAGKFERLSGLHIEVKEVVNVGF